MEIFSNKINLLKALAILIVVSGHLEFSLIPMFPPYSFQIALFFFISGMLFKEQYSFGEFFKRRFKTLMIPYIIYAIVYLGITFLITPMVGKFWGMPITLKNEILIPFLTGHQLDLIAPLWFVPQLFTSLIIYKVLDKFKLNTLVYVFLSLVAIQMQQFNQNLYILYLLRTMFSLLFIHLGHIYIKKIVGKYDIFSSKVFFCVILLQALLWITNADYTPADGIGLSYILVWGQFDNWIVPIITSITGIWASLFVINISYDYVKNWKFLHLIGQNTYHIMANHLLVFNFITYTLLTIKGIPFDIKNSADIYWFYSPLKLTYFYFVIGVIVTTYLGVMIKYVRKTITSIVCNKKL